MLRINDKIPEFQFDVYHEGNIKKLSFSDFRGKWLVLLFYPADFTFVCPTELEEAANYYNEFKDLGAEIISFSTDTAFSHKVWHETSKSISKIKYPMASDPSGKICKSFGTYIDEEGLSLRASFIFDPEGKLKFYEIHDNSIGRNIKEILRKLKASKYTYEHGGEVCPASWDTGKETIKPSTKLIGEI